MTEEQEKDENVQKVIAQLRNADAPKTIQEKYFISNPDQEAILRLVEPEHLQTVVTRQYHDNNGHMGIDKTYDSITQKYYWPNLYKKLYEYVSKCDTCQERVAKNAKPLVQETDIPPYPFAKIVLDLSGPYPQTRFGNRYIFSFIDLYTGLPEAFAVPDKSAENIAHLIIKEIFP